MSSYDEALANSKALENERDKLTKKYNSIEPENLEKIRKMLPDSVDNIRLILEIENIAKPYGMLLKDVKYDATKKEETKGDEKNNVVQAGSTASNSEQTAKKDYGVWTLEFSTKGSYANFLNLLKDLENNLRVVDISSIQFSSTEASGIGIKDPLASSDSYKYSFKINTYWLKN